MFIVRLTYLAPIAEIDALVPAHRTWVDQGFTDGVFLASGPLDPRTGGVILAHNTTRAALEARLDQDPFAKPGLVEREVVAMTVRVADPRLAFLVTT